MTLETMGSFDVMLFNGIVYHIRNPIGALQQMTRIARTAITVETFIDNLDNPRPVMTFYPGETAEPGYPQNGWGPNPKCMFAMLKTFGCQDILEFPTPDSPQNRSIFIGSS